MRIILLKEQKILMMAQDADNKEDTYGMLSEIIDGCTFNTIDISTMPLFDFEYLFMQIRCKSVGESAEVSVLCPDDNITRVPVTIDLSDIDVQIEDTHSNVIGVNENIKIIMRYPTVNDIKSVNDAETMSNAMKLIKTCILEIHDGDTIHNTIDATAKELDDFIDSLPTEVFEKLGNFFNTMPRVKHTITYNNPKSGKEFKLTLNGANDFF